MHAVKFHKTFDATPVQYYNSETGEPVFPNHCTGEHDCTEYSVPVMKGNEKGTLCLFCGKEDLQEMDEPADESIMEYNNRQDKRYYNAFD